MPGRMGLGTRRGHVPPGRAHGSEPPTELRELVRKPSVNHPLQRRAEREVGRVEGVRSVSHQEGEASTRTSQPRPHPGSPGRIESRRSGGCDQGGT